MSVVLSSHASAAMLEENIADAVSAVISEDDKGFLRNMMHTGYLDSVSAD